MATTNANCTYDAVYASLCFPKGKPVLPGVRSQLYVIRKADIVKWPELKGIGEADSTPANTAVYADSFTLAADKKWLRIDLVDNKGNITWETQGDKPARTFLNKFTATHPLIDTNAAGFQRMSLTDDLVYLVQQRDGQFRVLGNEMFETDTKPGGSTGEGVTGDFGSTFEIEVTDVCPAPFYRGKIEAEDGDIQLNATTGLPTTTASA